MPTHGSIPPMTTVAEREAMRSRGQVCVEAILDEQQEPVRVRRFSRYARKDSVGDQLRRMKVGETIFIAGITARHMGSYSASVRRHTPEAMFTAKTVRDGSDVKRLR